MEIKPIKSEADYDAAVVEIEGLMGAEPDTPEGDRLDILATLVEAYEARHHQIDPPDPIDAIRFRMEQAGLGRKDIEPLIGGRGRVSEIFSGRRRLTLPMIRKLHAALGIPAEVLIRERRRSPTRRPR